MMILLIEDDADTADFVACGLREKGHGVDLVSNGHEGLFRASGGGYEVMIIDRMLPGMDGLTIVKALRGAKVMSPALLLSALGNVHDRVEGLEAGADDYLVKPFDFAELLARVNALARRPPLAAAGTILKVEDLEMDLLERTVTRGTRCIELQQREFALLEYLMRNAGRAVTRILLLEKVWGLHFDPRTSVVETHISRLRAKIDRDFPCPLLHTVRGTGYRLGASA
jgi:two-component system OmpR family response regulator